jgi:outer membrane protein OmpA-like peptidoglycan-associated protein
MRQNAILVVAITTLAGTGIAMEACAQDADITLHPGLTVNFSIYGGYSSTGALLGDYDFINQVTGVTNGGYRYDYWFTGPAANSGSQTVSAEDKKTGTTLREFWPSGNMSAKGYVSYLAISDATFADLKAGKETTLHFDATEDPRTVKKIGEEDLTTLVNERPTVVHTIKIQGAAGGTFWILDDTALPMVVKGKTKWKWMATAISDSGSAGSLVVSSLQKTGEATTHAILFAFNSANLDREAKSVLDSVTQYLKANPNIRLELQGHTDNIGGAAFNLALSQKRADSVKTYLTSAGINGSQLTAKGYGLTVPVADNTTPEGRANNRRVVFVAR